MDSGSHHRLRLAVAGGDWPNVTAPPHPVTYEIDRSTSLLTVPALPDLDTLDEPRLSTVTPESLQSSRGITWTSNATYSPGLRRAAPNTASQWRSTHGYQCHEHHSTSVGHDVNSHEQSAEATTRYEVDYPEGRTATQSRLQVRTDATHLHLDVHVETYGDQRLLAERRWKKTIVRYLG